MAVCKVKKLDLIAHAQCREEILKTLRRLGSVHISDVRELFPETASEAPPFLDKSIAQIEAGLSRIRFCSEFVERFVAKPSFAEALLRTKPVFTEQESEDCLANFDMERFYEHCTEFEKEIADNESRIEKNEALMEGIAHWRGLDCPLELIRDTKTTRVTLGICDARACNPLTEALAEACSLCHTEIVERSRTSVSMLFIYHASAEETVPSILRQHGWRAVKFAGLTGVPAEILEELRRHNNELRERNERLRERIVKELVPSREKLLLLHDHYTQELETLKIQRNFLFTPRTFLINGWVVANHEEELRRRLEEVTRVVEIRCSDPGPDDKIPVLLENRPVAEPFALITELYGRPQYTEFDPTPFLAPFFVLFFAVCLGDAGYGLILAIGSYFALKKFQIPQGPKRLLKILFAGGLANIVVGLLTGGIFGIASDDLPAVFKALMLFSPTEQVLLFLYIAFGLGVIQVLVGIGVKMANNIRHGNISAALMDQGLWILFLVALVPIVFKGIFGGQVGEGTISIATGAAKILAIALVLTQGRHMKFILVRPLMGLLKLYDAMSYFGDVLSYARLMALGLATAYLGMAFNDMAKMSLDIPYGIGYVVAALLLVFSHIFNLIINCLGAFIHSLRLQYLEFFSKFFTGGGEPFNAFAEEREHTVVQSG